MFSIVGSNTKYLNNYTGVYMHLSTNMLQVVLCRKFHRRVMKIMLLKLLCNISCATNFSLSFSLSLKFKFILKYNIKNVNTPHTIFI